MTLRELISGLKARGVRGDLETEILGLAYDSRQVSAGDLFFAIRGTRLDGNRFMGQQEMQLVSDHPVCGAKVGSADIFLTPQPPLLTRRGLLLPANTDKFRG